MLHTKDRSQRINLETVQKPVVSVITPAYNAGLYIGEAIASVQAQSFVDWEMIIADDGSTDQTVKIVREFADHDPRIRIESFAHAGLPATSRNRALSLSRGRFVAFLDADDLWKPNKLNLQLSSLEHNQCKWGFANAHRFGNAGPNSNRLMFPESWQPVYPFMPKLLTGNGIPCLTVIVDRELLENVTKTGDISQAFDESPSLKVGEDWDLALRLSQLSEPDYIPEPLAWYRVHVDGISRSFERNYECAIALLRKYRQIGVSKELLLQAKNFHISKLSINRMLYSSKAWRKNLFVSCLSSRLNPRGVYLASLALMPKFVAQRMYFWGLSLIYRI
jgi:teichuronic acid biosynthesis glycosyltransferase TuaG